MRDIDAQDISRLPENKQIMFTIFCLERYYSFYKSNWRFYNLCGSALETLKLMAANNADQGHVKMAIATLSGVYVQYDPPNNGLIPNILAAMYRLNNDPNAYSTRVCAVLAATSTADAARHKYLPHFHASARNEVLEELWTFYDQLLNGDKYFEEIVLSGK